MRVELITELAKDTDTEIPEAAILRLKKEFGDVMWYLANISEYYAISQKDRSLGRLAMMHWAVNDLAWDATEDESSLAALIAANPLGEYLRAHMRLRSAAEDMFIRPEDLSATRERPIEPLRYLQRKLGWPGFNSILLRDFFFAAGEYLVALDKTLPVLFGDGFTIKDITDLNIEKLTKRKQDGTIFATDEVFGDDR